MNELPLFRTLRDPVPRNPPDLPYIRKSLNRLLRVARDAQILPWSKIEAEDWEKRFPELAAYLPADEAESLNSEFTREMARLRSST